MRFHVEVKRRQLKGELMARVRGMHNTQMARSWNRYRACTRYAEILGAIEDQDNMIDLEMLSPVPSWVRATFVFEKDLDEWNARELKQVTYRRIHIYRLDSLALFRSSNFPSTFVFCLSPAVPCGPAAAGEGVAGA